MTRQFALTNSSVSSAAAKGTPTGFLRFAALSFVALFIIALTVMPLGVRAQLSGTGAISGTVTDSSGAVVPNATVTATAVDTNEKTIRTTTGAGDFNITPLLPGNYSLTVAASGFEKYVQENITVNALETQAVNVKLSLGAAQQTITVTSAPPVLETTDATLGAVMDNQMYSSLPLLMGYGGNADQRRSTDFEYLMPGVQGNYTSNNSTDNSGIVNGSGPAGGVSEIYIDGINLPEADQVGDPRFVWTAFGMDSIDQFQVLTSAFSAQYAGQGVENYTVKSGGNQIHGSVYEYIRNTVADAWAINNKKPTVIGIVPAGQKCSSATLTASTSWCALGGVKATEIQNEYGIVLSGPIIKNKLFLSYNYGQYRDANGPAPQLQTVPTLAMMGYTSSGAALGYADFSGFEAANTGYNIYDPATQTPNCTGTACTRTQFAGNQIPATRVSQAAAYFNKFMLPYEAETNQSLYSNNIAPGYPTGLSNWYQAGRLDYNMSNSNQLSIIVAFGRQASTGPNSSGSANALGPPFNDKQAYTPKTNVDIVKETWTINPHIVNQAAISYGRYYSLSVTPEFAPVYDSASSGILNMPSGQAAGSFPEISYSGGVDDVTSEATYQGFNVKANNTYEASDGLQWEHGKHNFNFGAQVVEQQFNFVTDTTYSGPFFFTFAAAQTGGFTGSGNALNASTGDSFASYMLGGVSTTGGAGGASAPVVGVPGLGSRWLDPSFWGQDDWKLTQKLTLNLGLRWDIYPSIHEVHNLFTWLDTKGANNITGNKGTLAFAGGSSSDGFHTGTPTPSSTWYKNIQPRLGLAYAVTPKTVIRASYDLTYARGNWTSGQQKGSPSTVGLAPSATAGAGISSAPQYYWDGTACSIGEADSVACGWTGSVNPPAPPTGGASLAEFATTETSVLGTSGGSTMNYFDGYLGSRTPQYLNWTFGLEHQLTNDMSISVSYVGSEGHFISVSKAIGARNNENPESLAALAGYTLTASGASTQTPCTATATGCQFPVLAQKSTATDIALAAADGFAPPNPYSGATYVATNSVYQYYYPFPQFSGVSDNTSFVGNENWNALEITLRERPSHGLNFMLNYTYSKSIDDLGTFRVGDNDRLDRSLSTTDEPQNLAATVVYQLPIGRGHWGGDNFAYRAIASDWTVSGISVYHSGYPLAVTGSTGCGGGGILNQCMPSMVPGQSGRTKVKYGKAANGQPISFDTNAANSPSLIVGGVAVNSNLNTAAFTVATAGTATNYGTSVSTETSQVTNVGNGPALYVPGNAPRVGADNLWGMGTYNVDMAIKRSFPIYHEWKLAFEVDMTNVTNHVILASPNAAVNGGTYGEISAVGTNYVPREAQGSLRVSW